MEVKGRLNEDTHIFEAFYNNKWVPLDRIWDYAIMRVSNDFLVMLCCCIVEPYKKRAFDELKRRIGYKFSLTELWKFFLEMERPVGDLALNEIFEQSGKIYILPYDLNR